MASKQTLRLNDGTSYSRSWLNDEVKELQTLLRPHGYRLRIDGQFGPYTESIVILFQTSRGLNPDGIVGPTTWRLLLQSKPQPKPSNPSVTKPITPSPIAGLLRFNTSYSKFNKHMINELKESQKYASYIQQAAVRYNIQPSILGGLVSRESRWGLALVPLGPSGTGDNGHGRGLVQIDDRWHTRFVNSGKWRNARHNLFYGCSVMNNSIDYFRKKTDWSGLRLMKAGVAAYNAGPRRTYEAHFLYGQDLDYFTAGQDYSKDVLDKAGWFQLHGWS